ncbi:MAG: hypothetical protein ACI4LQ_07020, partial [Anaerovoracaceae bacterium]
PAGSVDAAGISGGISPRKAEKPDPDPLKAKTKNCIIVKIFCLDNSLRYSGKGDRRNGIFF